MKKLLTILTFFISTVLFAQPSLEWAAHFSGNNDAELIDQVVDDNGFIYSVGLFTGTVDFDPTASVYNLTSYGSAPTYYDIFITKQNSDKSLVWATKIITSLITYEEAVSDIALDPSGNLLITGYFQGNVDFDPGPGTYTLSTTSNQFSAFVLKLDTNAGFVWARNPNWKTKGVGITTDSNSNVYAVLNVNNPVGGAMISFPGGPTISSTSASFFIWKISSTGSTQWVKSGSGSNVLPIHCVQTNDNNDVVFAGRFGTGFLNLNNFSGPNNITGSGNENGFITKINSNGVHQWTRVLHGGASAWFYCRDIEVVDNSKFIVGGDFFSSCNFDPPSLTHSYTSAGSADGYLIEMDFNNNILASYTIGGISNEMVYAVSSNQAGQYYLGGRFQGTSDMDPSPAVTSITSSGDYDAFILKLNSSGNFDWVIGYGSAGYEETSVLNNLADTLYIGGEFENTIDFDPDVSVVNLGSGNDKDPFILKFTECIPIDLVADAITLSDLTDECIVSSPTVPTASNCLGSFNGVPDVSFPITAQGTTVVTWTYNDGNGNTSTQTQNVIIDDVTAPVADAGSLSPLNSECSVTPSAPTATDNCAGSIIGTPNVSFPLTTQGTTVITWTYDDGNGNTSTQTQNVIINDVTAPVPDIATLSIITNECSVTSLTAPTATDNCAGTITGTYNALLPITAQGTTVVTWTYDDGNGNTSTQTQNVVINDVTAPVPNSTTLASIISECSVTSLTAPTAIDNCAGTITGTHNATLPIITQGTTVITWTYDDGNGNTSTQTQNVIIDDVTAPVAIVGSLANVTAECQVTSLTAPTATDNCAGIITGTHNASLPITAQGTTVVTWIYDDGNGNTSTQTQNVIIDDVTAPVANVGTLANVTAECQVTSLTAPTATDNCAGSITGTHNASLPITAQGTTVVTWTYDDGNGNTTTQTQNVIIDDVTAPVPDNGSLTPVISQCQVTSIIAPTATDNCSGILTGTPNVTFPITSQGTFTVTWTYDDGNGNTSTQTQSVTIDDVTAPVPDNAILSAINDECSATPSAPTAADNCTGTITATPDVIFPITTPGTTVVTWMYDDGNGNTSTQTQDVIITPIDNGITQVDAVTLSADASGYNYQWVDCDNGNAPIAGATNQSFIASANGSYSVEIDNGTCMVTSNCIAINQVELSENVLTNISVYPNPTTGLIHIQSTAKIESIKLMNALGQLVGVYSANQKTIEIKTSPGMYFLRITANGKESFFQVVKH